MIVASPSLIVTEVEPLDSPVIVTVDPDTSAVAMSSLANVGTKVLTSIASLYWSNALTLIASSVPSTISTEDTLASSVVTTRSAASTVIVIVWVTLPEVTVIVVSPADTGVITPFAPTNATALLEDSYLVTGTSSTSSPLTLVPLVATILYPELFKVTVLLLIVSSAAFCNSTSSIDAIAVESITVTFAVSGDVNESSPLVTFTE